MHQITPFPGPGDFLVLARGGVMADQATQQSPAVSPALAEPTAHVRAGWVTELSLASLAMWMASYTPLQVLLPIQLRDITPQHKLAALGVVSALGAVASVLATPITGALSDRTTHSRGVAHLRGRRHRWTLAMALPGAASLVIMVKQTTVAGSGQAPPLTGPRPTRAIWRLCATSRPAASQTSASSSNHPPLTLRHRAATCSAPGTGTPRIYQVISTVGAQPVAPRPNTTGGSPSTARASR
jgi:hypothetical protein